MRQDYKRNCQSYLSQTSTQQPALNQQISAVSYQSPQHPLPPVAQVSVPPPPPPPINGNSDQRSIVSEVTTDCHNPTFSIMGSRNEQASLRSCNSNIRQICTSERHVCMSNTCNIEPPVGQIGHCEADSNADTCCPDNNFIPINITNRTADVYPYDESYTPMTNVPIILGATAYDGWQYIYPCLS